MAKEGHSTAPNLPEYLFRYRAVFSRVVRDIETHALRGGNACPLLATGDGPFFLLLNRYK